MEFSPDGRWLATGSWDSSLKLWSLSALESPVEDLIEQIESDWQMGLEDALSSTTR